MNRSWDNGRDYGRAASPANSAGDVNSERKTNDGGPRARRPPTETFLIISGLMKPREEGSSVTRVCVAKGTKRERERENEREMCRVVQ